MHLLLPERRHLRIIRYVGRDVKPQTVAIKECTFKGDNRTQGLFARAHFHKSIAGRFPVVLVSDDIGASYDAIGSNQVTELVIGNVEHCAFANIGVADCRKEDP